MWIDTAESRSLSQKMSGAQINMEWVSHILRQLMGHAAAAAATPPPPPPNCLKCQYSVTVYVLISWGFVCNASVNPAMDENWFSPTDGSSRASETKPPIYFFFLLAIDLLTFRWQGTSIKATAPLNIIYASSNLRLCHPSHSASASCDQYFMIWLLFATTACCQCIMQSNLRMVCVQLSGPLCPPRGPDSTDELCVHVCGGVSEVVALARHLFSCSAEWSVFGENTLTRAFVSFMVARWPLGRIDLCKISAAWRAGCGAGRPLTVSLYLPPVLNSLQPRKHCKVLIWTRY